MGLRILTWLFPWLMSVLEFLLRASAGHSDAWEFIGPTVGGAALGLMLPLTRARVIRREKPPAEWNAPEIDGARTSLLIGFIIWLCAVVVDLARGGKQ